MLHLDQKMIKTSDGVHGFLVNLSLTSTGEENFDCLTPIEFECIVDIKKFNDSDEEDVVKKGENLARALSWEKIIH